ncbi:hypothetical protein [Methylacidimicrobium sp. B4]|uniref:hypothetical protein n=1 Tax=Methylacidimicrobium sp. B4 TaxID=2796139 RepID=UPI001A8C54D2|nr:hypothetical protein [Methylacidimicrobium sp. B4]QSR84575.1 hypothetical protein MacB4_10320 [Methylacidimicrobium sp. B4]
MSVEIRSTDDILAALDSHPDWADAVIDSILADERRVERIRRRILTDDLVRLPEEFQKARDEWREDRQATWEAIEKLTNGIGELREQVSKLTMEMSELRGQVSKLTDEMGELRGQVSKLTGVVGRHDGHIARLRGTALEQLIANDPEKYVGDIADDVERVSTGDLKAILAKASNALTPSEARMVRRLDFCLRGRRGDRAVFLAVEASCAVGVDDVERVMQRSGYLARAMAADAKLRRVPVLPVVVGDEISSDAMDLALANKVLTVVDERLETHLEGR